jgi:hypothetical protein
MPGAFPLVPRYEHHGIRRRPFGDYVIFFTALRLTRFPIAHILSRPRARLRSALLFPEQ